jgi:hypothetical protein
MGYRNSGSMIVNKNPFPALCPFCRKKLIEGGIGCSVDWMECPECDYKISMRTLSERYFTYCWEKGSWL